MSDFEKKLAKDLQRGRDYREAYAEAFANEVLATQIQMLRKQRGLTQAQLGERIGSNQGRISVYEDEEYGRWSLDTLRKIASEFGLWVKISFESYSTLVAEAAQFDAHNLLRNGFEEDQDLQRWLEEEQPATWRERTRRAVATWASAPLPNLAVLSNWLQGDLPEFDPQVRTPVQHLREAVPASDADLWNEIARAVARLLAAEEDGLELPPTPNPAIYQENLFGLADVLGPRAEIRDALEKAYTWVERTFGLDGQTGLGTAGENAMLRAMVHNQVDDRWREPVWTDSYLKRGCHPFLPGGAMMGIRGLLGLPENEDYWRNLARGIRDLERRLVWDETVDVLDELEGAFALIFDRSNSPEGARNLVRASVELMVPEGSWSQYATAAWAHAVKRLGWHEAAWNVAPKFERTTLANMFVDGLPWYRDYKKARGVETDLDDLAFVADRARKEVTQPN
jgi:transcriptional regulator with XRE-family HTH domain